MEIVDAQFDVYVAIFVSSSSLLSFVANSSSLSLPAFYRSMTVIEIIKLMLSQFGPWGAFQYGRIQLAQVLRDDYRAYWVWEKNPHGSRKFTMYGIDRAPHPCVSCLQLFS